jgi:hypothetical protein
MAVVEPHGSSHPERPKTKDNTGPSHPSRAVFPTRKMVCLFRDQWVRLRDLFQAYRILHEDRERRWDRNAGALRWLARCRRGWLGFDLVAGRARGCRRGGGSRHRRCRLLLGPRRRRRERCREKRNQKGLPDWAYTQTPRPVSSNDATELSPMGEHTDIDIRPRIPVEVVCVLTQVATTRGPGCVSASPPRGSAAPAP